MEEGAQTQGEEVAGGFCRRRAAVRLGWVLGLVILDLVSKGGVFAWVGDLDAAGELVRDRHGHNRLPLLGTEWFAFMLSMNPGAAFGQLGDIPHLLVGLRIACVFALATWLVGAEINRRVSVIALALILAGATGNLFDNLILVETSEAVKAQLVGAGWAAALHVAAFVVFGAMWCLGGVRLRWGAVLALVCTALFLEWTDNAPTYGAVRDFIDVYTPQWRDTLPWGAHFPTFNVADSCITVGAVLLLLTGWGNPKKDEPEAIAQTPAEG